MLRRLIMPVTMFVLGAVAVLAWTWPRSQQPITPVPAAAAKAIASTPAAVPVAVLAPAPVEEAPPVVDSPAVVESPAPQESIAALERQLSVASTEDRARILQSLRTLAIEQGDPDDRIRSVVRKVIYHDGDEAFTQLAQTTLDEIEQDLKN